MRCEDRQQFAVHARRAFLCGICDFGCNGCTLAQTLHVSRSVDGATNAPRSIMKIKSKTTRPAQSTSSIAKNHARAERIETGAVSGAIAGGALGSVAGPVGAAAGVVVGGAVGAVAGLAMSDAAEMRHARAAKIDLEIGVTGGELGAPALAHPKVGAASDDATTLTTKSK